MTIAQAFNLAFESWKESQEKKQEESKEGEQQQQEEEGEDGEEVEERLLIDLSSPGDELDGLQSSFVKFVFYKCNAVRCCTTAAWPPPACRYSGDCRAGRASSGWTPSRGAPHCSTAAPPTGTTLKHLLIFLTNLLYIHCFLIGWKQELTRNTLDVSLWFEGETGSPARGSCLTPGQLCTPLGSPAPAR